MPTRDEIAQQALALPIDDRAFLADMLEQSLREDENSLEELTATWTAEIDRRLEAHRQDSSRVTDGESALSEISEQLQVDRSGKPA